MNNLSNTDTGNNDNLQLATGFIWKTRYSTDEKSDNHGRWARLCFFNGFLISWINKMNHEKSGAYYIAKDFFPSNGNDMPTYSEVCFDFEKAKEEVEKRFNKFLKACC
jgi:hypothetical protein